MDAEQTFHLERRSGIGGSDAAAVCGVDPWRTPLEVYEQKLGLSPPLEDSIDLQRGRRNEDWAVDCFEADTGFDVIRQPPVMRHISEPHMIVHLDGIVIEDRNDTLVFGYPLEVKCPRLHNFYSVKKGGATDAMICQLQHGMAVDGPKAQRGYFVVFHSDVGHIHFPMDRDDALIERIMDRERVFWSEYVEKETPPPESYGMEAAEELDLPEGVGAEVVRIESEDWARLMTRLREARELRDEANALYGEKLTDGGYSGVLGEVTAFMDKLGLEAAEGAGAKVYWRKHDGARYFNMKALRAAAPLDAMLVQEVLLERFNGDKLRQVIEDLKDCRLDLSRFDARREPYKAVRAYLHHE
jgi:putative phage-type endonuclease